MRNLKISFCTTCMGRTHHLKQTLLQNIRDNLSYGEDNLEFVILDYSSPDDLKEWIHSDPDIGPYLKNGVVKYFESPGHTVFRHAEAKNLAHFKATGDIVCNLDADNFTGPGFADYLNRQFTKNINSICTVSLLCYAWMEEKNKGCIGRIALSRDNFIKINGYDDQKFAKGWGGEDDDIVRRAREAGLKKAGVLDSKYLQTVDHSDEERVAFCELDHQEDSLKRIEDVRTIFEANRILRIPLQKIKDFTSSPKKSSAARAPQEMNLN